MTIRAFRKEIYLYYAKNRRSFPWRNTKDPYRILVSEYMLQQTQTSRVVEKYKQFLKEFPDFERLAQAPFHKVLRLWHGLGYNRRALSLHQTAQIVFREFGGNLPKEKETLQTLPGVGPYTASAIRTFAFGLPEVFLETNIRTVFIHFFFHGKTHIRDEEIIPYIKRTLDRKNPRKWYFALMDYGAMLKKTARYNSRSAHYRKQSPFKGSNRELRGKVLRLLLEKKRSEKELREKLGLSKEKTEKLLEKLHIEGFIAKRGKFFMVK